MGVPLGHTLCCENRPHGQCIIYNPTKDAGYQARWQEKLAEFNITWEHKLGWANVVPDTLSHMALIRCCATTLVDSDLLTHIQATAVGDAHYQLLLQCVHDDMLHQFHLGVHGLLMAEGDRPLIPATGVFQ